MLICGDVDEECVCGEVGDIPADFESRMGLVKPVCRAREDCDAAALTIGPAPLICVV